MNIKNKIRDFYSVAQILNIDKLYYFLLMPLGIYFIYSWTNYSKDSAIMSGIMGVMTMSFYKQQKIMKTFALLPMDRMKLLNYMLVSHYAVHLPLIVAFLLGYGDYSVKIIINYLSTLMLINLSLTSLNTLSKFIIMMCCIVFIKVNVGFIFMIPIGIGSYVYLRKNFLK